MSDSTSPIYIEGFGFAIKLIFHFLVCDLVSKLLVLAFLGDISFYIKKKERSVERVDAKKVK